jgi:hypothetical protein
VASYNLVACKLLKLLNVAQGLEEIENPCSKRLSSLTLYIYHVHVRLLKKSICFVVMLLGMCCISICFFDWGNYSTQKGWSTSMHICQEMEAFMNITFQLDYRLFCLRCFLLFYFVCQSVRWALMKMLIQLFRRRSIEKEIWDWWVVGWYVSGE